MTKNKKKKTFRKCGVETTGPKAFFNKILPTVYPSVNLAMHPIFTDVLGHHRAGLLLSRVLTQNAPAHAYVFSGPAAVGKSMVAVRFAAALVGTTVDRLALHPDVLTLARPEESTAGGRRKEIPVDEVRAVIGRLALSPVGTRHVLIIHDADGLNTSGQNALLKTLEDPAGESVVIFVVDEEEQLLPTVRSRAVPVRFGLVDPQVIVRALHARGQEDAETIAALARGRPGAAFVLCDPAVRAVAADAAAAVSAWWRAPLAQRVAIIAQWTKGEDRDAAMIAARWEALAALLTQRLAAGDLAAVPAAQQFLISWQDAARANANLTLALEGIALGVQ